MGHSVVSTGCLRNGNAANIVAETALELAQLCESRGRVPVAVARPELRKWLTESSEDASVDATIKRLLGSE